MGSDPVPVNVYNAAVRVLHGHGDPADYDLVSAGGWAAAWLAAKQWVRQAHRYGIVSECDAV